MNTRRNSVRRHINLMLITAAAAILVILIAAVMLPISINNRYAGVLRNANAAVDFNKEFKQTIDSQMYRHVIQPRSEDPLSDLPMQELDNAVKVLERLRTTTTLRDNSWRIESMLNMCESLRTYMEEIATTPRYDDRMELLERNIRGETGLTKLIETYMHDYIYDELLEMSRLQESVRRQIRLSTAAIFATAILFSALLFLRATAIAGKIANPITALTEKANRFGQGTFIAEPVPSDIAELQTLDHVFDDMGHRIDSLMATQIEHQKTLHRAELELLQAQINPHFLYNTLDSIAILAENDEMEDVVTMVNSLSTFFRNSLSRGESIISLRTEQMQVQSYLEIQQIRYSDRMTYEIRIEETILDCFVPKLILQPLVENALYHGIKNRRRIGHITITGHTEGNGSLVLKVIDDGTGMDEHTLQTLRAGLYADRHTGLGLSNVHKRIRLYCGAPYGLSFDSVPDEGTTVTVRLPLDLQPETMEETA